VAHHIPGFGTAVQLCKDNVVEWGKVASGDYRLLDDEAGTLEEITKKVESAPGPEPATSP
jgi:hypothetical protein